MSINIDILHPNAFDAGLINEYMSAHRLAFDNESTERWFDWKFNESEREIFISLARDGMTVAGANAYSVMRFNFFGRVLRVGVVRDTFVARGYQGKGIFGKLLASVEEYASIHDVDFLLIFPNLNSTRGVLKRGWVPSKIPLRNYIKIATMRGGIHALSLRKKFVYSSPGLRGDPLPDRFLSANESCLVVDDQYIRRRITASPYGSYAHFSVGENSYISRFGMRGSLREVNFLYWSSFERSQFREAMLNAYDLCAPDIVTVLTSDNWVHRDALRSYGFIPARSKVIPTAFSVKGASVEEFFDKLVFTGFDFHTY